MPLASPRSSPEDCARGLVPALAASANLESALSGSIIVLLTAVEPLRATEPAS